MWVLTFLLIETIGVPGGIMIEGWSPFSSPHRHGGSARYPASSYMSSFVFGFVLLPWPYLSGVWGR